MAGGERKAGHTSPPFGERSGLTYGSMEPRRADTSDRRASLHATGPGRPGRLVEDLVVVGLLAGKIGGFIDEHGRRRVALNAPALLPAPSGILYVSRYRSREAKETAFTVPLRVLLRDIFATSVPRQVPYWPVTGPILFCVGTVE